MSSKSKSNKQQNILVCGNCGIDLIGSHFRIKSRYEATAYRCELCAEVDIKTTETELLVALEDSLDKLNDGYAVQLLWGKTAMLWGKTPTSCLSPSINIIRYTKVYLTKLIDMLKNDLKTLNIHKYKLSKQYLIALSRKLIDEAEVLSEQGKINEEYYRVMCESIQDYLDEYDGIFNTKLIMIINKQTK